MLTARLAFTCGDPAGIGPEIIAAWMAEHPAEARDTAVIGPARWLESLPVAGAKISAGPAAFATTPGRPTAGGAQTAWAAMERAAAGCKSGEFTGVVTGPVSKEWLARVGYAFPGQTEFFAARWGGEPTMAFCGGRLRVVLLTWHIALRDVPSRLTETGFARAVRAAEELARAFPVEACLHAIHGEPSPASRLLPHSHPRIGVCGLNPHAGEDGLMGDEEKTVINPILSKLRAAHPGLSVCLPADTIFARALRGEFDVIIALYHDQGLAPLKTVDFDEAVNVTLGLPFVRTSPDHGTAFGIAGLGRANPRSFANAVKVAKRLITKRSGCTFLNPEI